MAAFNVPRVKPFCAFLIDVTIKKTKKTKKMMSGSRQERENG